MNFYSFITFSLHINAVFLVLNCLDTFSLSLLSVISPEHLHNLYCSEKSFDLCTVSLILYLIVSNTIFPGYVVWTYLLLPFQELALKEITLSPYA